MSEYQYYEFLAVDRPLDPTALAAVRALSTRARITPSSFMNTYHWGDFRGNPRALVERYYDAFLHTANWGTRQFMFRLPTRVLDPGVAEQYCATDAASTWTRDGHVLIDLTYTCEDGGDWDVEDDLGEGKLASIIPARADLAAGDLRLLYLAWLHSVSADQVDPDDVEPPVPAGLDDLPASLHALVDLLRIDADLLAVAAQASPQLVQRVLVEHGRDLLRDHHPASDPPRHVHLGQGPHHRHRDLHCRLERTLRTLHLDPHCRRDHRQDQPQTN